MPARVRRVLALAGARIASATSITFARDSDASTTVLPFAVSALTVNGRNQIRRLVLNRPPRTTPACPPDLFSKGEPLYARNRRVQEPSCLETRIAHRARPLPRCQCYRSRHVQP